MYSLRRARAVLERSTRALMVTLRSSERIAPRRCAGAVQVLPELPAAATAVRGWAWFGGDDLSSVMNPSGDPY